MTLPWQIAQKLHAVTAELDGGRVNDRAHDLVDLQILEALVFAEPMGPVFLDLLAGAVGHDCSL